MDQGVKEAGVSRREFLKNASLVVGGAAVAGLAGCSPKATALTQEPNEVIKEVVKEVPKELQKSIGHIVHNPDICAGCRTCLVVCSIKNEGVSSLELSRLQLTCDELGGWITEMYMCKQCDGPECVLHCPTGALHIDTETGARVVDKDVCIGCKTCLSSCPCTPPRVRFNAKTSKSFKCDLCGGDPQCVKFCPTGALTASWIKTEAKETAQNGIPVKEVIDTNIATWSHFKDIKVTQIASGILVTGTMWTSHATHSSVDYGDFKLIAEFLDTNGVLLGKSEEVSFQIPEMKSYSISLQFVTGQPELVSSVVLKLSGVEVRVTEE